MRISDWSSDVCSSDLHRSRPAEPRGGDPPLVEQDRAFLADPFLDQPRQLPTPLRLASLIALQVSRPSRMREGMGVGKSANGKARSLEQRACFEQRKTDNARMAACDPRDQPFGRALRSEEHTSELQSLMRISYAVFCLKKQ